MDMDIGIGNAAIEKKIISNRQGAGRG